MSYSANAKFDKQGSYFWSLVKQADWDKKRVELMFIKKFEKTHWNVLTTSEKSASISIMKSYAEKNKLNYSKKLRQRIMANAI